MLSNLTIAANGLSATATFTATDNLKGTGSVSVAAGKFTDMAGNQNNPSNTATVAIDTQNPGVTVDIVDPTLNDADNTSQVTFTFSEPIAAGSFTLADVSVANGVLSNLTIAADSLSAAPRSRRPITSTPMVSSRWPPTRSRMGPEIRTRPPISTRCRSTPDQCEDRRRPWP